MDLYTAIETVKSLIRNHPERLTSEQLSSLALVVVAALEVAETEHTLRTFPAAEDKGCL